MPANTLEVDSGNNWVYPKVLSLYETVISVYLYPKVLSLYETVISVYCGDPFGANRDPNGIYVIDPNGASICIYVYAAVTVSSL